MNVYIFLFPSPVPSIHVDITLSMELNVLTFVLHCKLSPTFLAGWWLTNSSKLDDPTYCVSTFSQNLMILLWRRILSTARCLPKLTRLSHFICQPCESFSRAFQMSIYSDNSHTNLTRSKYKWRNTK